MKPESFKYLKENYKDQPNELREALSEYIRSLGITPTKQYVVVFEAVLMSRAHPTVDDIYRSLRQSVPELSRSRIYTILEILERIGAVSVVCFNNNVIYYDAETAHHGHMLCDRCGEVTNVRVCDELEERIAALEGIEVRRVQVLCEGLCAKCIEATKIN